MHFISVARVFNEFYCNNIIRFVTKTYISDRLKIIAYLTILALLGAD